MPFVAFYHTHKLVVVLFLLIYVVKTVLLLTNNKQGLAKFSSVIKIPEMVVSAAFFISGIVMLMKIADFNLIFTIKLILVIGSIPLAIVAYKKFNKIFAVLSLLMLISAYGLAEMNKAKMGKRQPVESVISDPAQDGYSAVTHGKALFVAQCAVCHGIDGTLELSGAKNLHESVVADDYIVNIINNGKNTMPKMKGLYSENEMAALKAYIKNLRE
jgi:cytochrome c553